MHIATMPCHNVCSSVTNNMQQLFTAAKPTMTIPWWPQFSATMLVANFYTRHYLQQQNTLQQQSDHNTLPQHVQQIFLIPILCTYNSKTTIPMAAMLCHGTCSIHFYTPILQNPLQQYPVHNTLLQHVQQIFLTPVILTTAK